MPGVGEFVHSVCQKVMEKTTENEMFGYGLAGAVGGVLGMMISFAVNCSLIEITLNGVFALYFGILFMIIGALVFQRIRSGDHPHPIVLYTFAGMTFLSGLLCFLSETSWYMSYSAAVKVPLYVLLGVSICFALVFSLIDLINYFAGYCQGDSSRPLVENETQVLLVALTSVALGSIFGFVFGMMDLEDTAIYLLRERFVKEQRVCYPLAACVGAVSSMVNFKLRQNSGEYRFDPISDDMLDDDDML